MTVIIAEQTPPKVRGLLKRWFIEPKPNVFVGTVNRRTRDKVLEYILKHDGDQVGMLVISDDNSSQGFSVISCRETTRTWVKKSGHFLIAEKWEDSKNDSEEDSDDAAFDDKLAREALEAAQIEYRIKK